MHLIQFFFTRRDLGSEWWHRETFANIKIPNIHHSIDTTLCESLSRLCRLLFLSVLCHYFLFSLNIFSTFSRTFPKYIAYKTVVTIAHHTSSEETLFFCCVFSFQFILRGYLCKNHIGFCRSLPNNLFHTIHDYRSYYSLVKFDFWPS